MSDSLVLVEDCGSYGCITLNRPDNAIRDGCEEGEQVRVPVAFLLAPFQAKAGAGMPRCIIASSPPGGRTPDLRQGASPDLIDSALEGWIALSTDVQRVGFSCRDPALELSHQCVGHLLEALAIRLWELARSGVDHTEATDDQTG